MADDFEEKVLGDDTIVTFKAEPQPIGEAALIEACKMCPVEALFVIKDGMQIVPE